MEHHIKNVILTISLTINMMLIIVNIVLNKNIESNILLNREIIQDFQTKYVGRQLDIDQRFFVLDRNFKEIQKMLDYINVKMKEHSALLK